jgi:hypothetical protein
VTSGSRTSLLCREAFSDVSNINFGILTSRFPEIGTTVDGTKAVLQSENPSRLNLNKIYLYSQKYHTGYTRTKTVICAKSGKLLTFYHEAELRT